MSEKQKLTAAIKVAKDYYDTLYSLFHRNIPRNLTLPLPPSYTPKDELEERAIKLEKKFMKIYTVYNPQMNLPYYESYFSWWEIWDEQNWVRERLLNYVSQVVIGLETLKNRVDLETPAPQAEDTKTLKLDKKSYTAKEIAKLLSIALTTFYTLPNKLQDFPEPVDPEAKVNRRWSKEAVEKIYSAYQKYKKDNPPTPPVKSAVPTRSKKHREHPKRKVRK